MHKHGQAPGTTRKAPSSGGVSCPSIAQELSDSEAQADAIACGHELWPHLQVHNALDGKWDRPMLLCSLNVPVQILVNLNWLPKSKNRSY